MAYSKSTIYTVECHPDGIRLSWEDDYIDMRGPIAEGVWETIANYCETDPLLWEALSEDNLRMSEDHKDDLLFGESLYFEGSGWTARYYEEGYETWIDVIMEGLEGDRIMTMRAGYMEVHYLEEGYSPLEWEDGMGNSICYDNGLPYIDGERMEWAVEVIDHSDGSKVRTYHIDRPHAYDAAESAWDDMDPKARMHSEVRYGMVWSCSEDLLSGWERIAQDWTDAVTCTKTIRRSGNALTVAITEEVRLMGLEAGDVVEVTIKKL